MSPVERREAEGRVKAVLFSSMVGLFVGLVVATFIESEQRPAPPTSPEPVVNDESNEPKDSLQRHVGHNEGNHT